MKPVFMRKGTLILMCVFFFLTGFVTDRIYQKFQVALAPPQKQIMPAPTIVVAPKPEIPPVKPEVFFQSLNVAELQFFDQIYEQRQNQLRDIMAQGSQEGNPMVPQGVFAQYEMIQSKIDFLGKMQTYTESQNAVKNLFLIAYQTLQETFEKEIEFLKNYQMQKQNISFITQNIFEISSKDQRSGIQFIDSLVAYRKLMTEAIREDQSPEKNESHVRDLVTLNNLIEKYKIRLNVPKDTI